MISRNQSDPDLLSDTMSHGHAAAQHDRYVVAQLLRGRGSDSQLRGPGFEPCAAV